MEGGAIHVVTHVVGVEHPEDEVTPDQGPLNHLVILVHIPGHVVDQLLLLDMIGMVQDQLVQEMITVKQLMMVAQDLSTEVADHILTHQINSVTNYVLLGNSPHAHTPAYPLVLIIYPVMFNCTFS